MRLKIGARQSDLARLQAYLVGGVLKKALPQIEVEYQFKASLGDKNLTDPLWKMPEKGVFTEDFLADLREGNVDIVVHSWKDLPTEERTDTLIAATLPRADLRDIFFLKKDNYKKTKNLRIYSSSPRRACNLKPFLSEHLPWELQNIEFISVRGNVPTRFKKFMADDVDGFVMAKAALDRLLGSDQKEFEDVKSFLKGQISRCLWMVLPVSANPPAAAQGALAIEVLRKRTDLIELLHSINDRETFNSVTQERKILKSYGGGCHQKIGVAVLDRPYGQILSLRGLSDQGEILEQWKILKAQNKKFSKDEVWPLSSEEKIRFNREVLPVNLSSLTGKSLWVAKYEAWPKGFEPLVGAVVWCSGLETWKKLARRGIWVNGSSEGLGEQEDMRIEVLAPNVSWVKLTHDGVEDTSRFPKLATYRLSVKEAPRDLASKKCFFWSSASALREALKLYPEIRTQYHACGPGNTYHLARKLIGDESRIQVYLGHRDWLKHVTD